ncbi:G-protein coupled receptor daf-37-like [Liolophura sinensis]|uniref:G-protein coupled receptor daf-37-like n=1 Tax=Liolophura sinensis TaxID=3198878 RepID=UPI0031593DBB
MNTTEIAGDGSNSTDVIDTGPCVRLVFRNITIFDCEQFPPSLQLPYRKITGPQLVLWGVVLPIIGVLGLICNTLTFMVLRRHSLNSTFLVFLRVLVISDILVVVLVPAHSTIETYLAFSFSSKFIYFKDKTTAFVLLCLHYLASTSFTWNVWLSVVITVDRFISLCFPLRASSIRSTHYARRTIVFTTVFVVAFRIPYYLTTTVISCGIPGCYMYSFTRIGEMQWNTVYRKWPTSLVNFIVPLCLLFALNACILYKLNQFASKRKMMISGAQEDLNSVSHRKEREWNLAVALVITVFVVCQTPVFVEDFFWFDNDTLGQVFVFSVNILIVLNSSVNIFIYTAMGKSFRKELMQLISCKP